MTNRPKRFGVTAGLALMVAAAVVGSAWVARMASAVPKAGAAETILKKGNHKRSDGLPYAADKHGKGTGKQVIVTIESEDPTIVFTRRYESEPRPSL